MKKIVITILFALSAAIAFGQGTKDVRINEILVKNIDNYEDDYGHRSSWLELYNTGHSKVNIGGCYLKVIKESGDTIMYRVPTGDPRTELGPLGYCVFFCEGTGTKGTFYTNFTLESVVSLTLLNASGKGVINEVDIDYERQGSDVSIGYMTRSDGEEVFTTLPQTTPRATNDTEPLMPRHERFRQMDPYGGMMALIAIVVVLSVLTILFLCFKMLGNYNVRLSRKKVAAAKPENEIAMADSKSYVSPYTGEEVAAIVMALKMYSDDLHDEESKILTINKVARAYSPWSSKIYGLRQFTKK